MQALVESSCSSNLAALDAVQTYDVAVNHQLLVLPPPK